MPGATKRLARLFAAVVFVVPVILGSLVTTSAAAPTQEDVDAAKAKLNQLGEELEVAIEAYNEAKVQLSAIQEKLNTALEEKQAAGFPSG